jgi:3-oxoacyl-[acyl-carrier protein] reductase
MIKQRARVLAGFTLGALRKAADKARAIRQAETRQVRAKQRAVATSTLTGKRVLITGSTRGIGKALAEAFVQQGANVVVHGRRESVAREVAQALAKLRPSEASVVLGFGADLAQAGAGRDLVERALSELHGLDIVINNAAIHDPRRKPFWETSSEEMLGVVRVNLLAAFDVSAAAAASMLAEDVAGRIINISTTAANPSHVSNAGIASYGISKVALEGLSHYLSAESQHVTVTTIRPGTIDTDMVAPLFSLDRRWRMLPPESMVPPILHLACAPHAQVHGRIFEQLELMNMLASDPIYESTEDSAASAP